MLTCNKVLLFKSMMQIESECSAVLCRELVLDIVWQGPGQTDSQISTFSTISTLNITDFKMLSFKLKLEIMIQHLTVCLDWSLYENNSNITEEISHSKHPLLPYGRSKQHVSKREPGKKFQTVQFPYRGAMKREAICVKWTHF